MSNLPVTAVIPVRNGAATIERAVKSAIDAGCDYVYVFDDASTDDTKDIVKQFLGYGRVGLSSSDFHVGVNYARNYLISRTGDSLIIPLDADDELIDIRSLRDAWVEGTWCYGNHHECNHHTEDIVIKGLPAGLMSRKNITGVTFLFHRDDWQKVGGYDPDFAYAEDYAMQCNLTHNGVKPVYVDTTVYHRYMRQEGNERSVLAGEYWQFYRTMARRKYPNVFTGMG
jgi:glycosyltransferase involved in cell wall biosynthesis